MPKNTMQDLRNHLFETLEALKDDEKPMDIDRAKAVCEVAEQLINSARVEVKFMEVTGENIESDMMSRTALRLKSGEPADRFFKQ